MPAHHTAEAPPSPHRPKPLTGKVMVTAVEGSDVSSSTDGESPAADGDQRPRSTKKKLKERSVLLLPILLVMILATVVALALVFSMHPKHYTRAATSRLPSFPLAVRSPYLSTWLPGSFSADVTTAQPEFWNGERLTWSLMARVTKAGSSTTDSYALFGLPAGVHGAKPAQQQGTMNHTSTHTTVSLAAGDVTFLLDFFSPVSPKNYTRQTMPYSYLTVQASSASASDIQILNAIDGAWTGRPQLARGNLTVQDGTSTFNVENPGAYLYSENSGEDQALWGTTVFAAQAAQSDRLDSACASNSTLYSDFIGSGNVSGSACAQGDLYAHVHHLTGVTAAAKQVTFAVGLYQEDAINFRNKSQTPYFRSKYPTLQTSMAAFFTDYEDALSESKRLDQAIVTAGDAVSTNYTDILEASVRQAFAAVEITIPTDTMSTATEDVNGFLKEISSDGNLNSIDAIYPSFPIFYVLGPDYIRAMLQPVLSYLATPTGVWDLPQVPHDLGNHYPNATGHDDNHLEVFGDREESMPIESTGQTMHMLMSYVNATGDHAFVSRFMGAGGKYLLTTYADYLVSNGTHPPKQLTTVDALPERANTTQLAITAALGISAMGAMTGLANYTQAGAELTDRLLNDATLGAIASNRFTYDYQDPDSFSVQFPLFVDKLWDLAPANSFAKSYAMQSAFYGSLLDQYPWGVPYSSLQNWAIVDWNMWSAAICSADVSKRIVDSTWRFLTQGQMNIPFGTKYIVEGKDAGKWIGNKARPTVGANFALLALKGANLKW